MVSENLVSSLRQLSRAEKLQMMQFLIAELAQDEGVMLIPNRDYPIWTPLEAYDAASTMQQMLSATSETNSNG